jgi:phosphoenolpyruvate synthase/pyruvate phosphate dikinase
MENEAHRAEDVSAYTAERLAYFRERIETIELQPDFVRSLRERFSEWGPDGSFGVFVRSDTNVEDLAEFSGAGLNLTVPNVLRFDSVLTAIRRVWASPFTERAYGWRGSILENPEHTYVSVLIQRSVPVDKSGVMVTTDLATGEPGRLTIGVAEGVGGTVGGEAAEALLVSRNGGISVLLSQFKAPDRRLLRMTGNGGVIRIPSSGSDRVLAAGEIQSLKDLASDIEDRFEPQTGAAGNALPWDVEFGFLDGHLWLFQIRPLASDTPTAQLAGLAALDGAVRERGDRSVDLTGPLGGLPVESP